MKEKALGALCSISLESIFHKEDEDGILYFSELKSFEDRINDLRSRAETADKVTYEEAVEEYNEINQKILELKNINESLAYEARYGDSQRASEEITQNNELIDLLEATIARRLVDYAENGQNLLFVLDESYDISDEILQLCGYYMDEGTGENAAKSLTEFCFTKKMIELGVISEEDKIKYMNPDMEGERIPLDERIQMGLATLNASEGNALPLDVYNYMMGYTDCPLLVDSQYIGYPDNQRYMIALHLMTADTLTENEMPKWWMKKNLKLPTEYTATEENINDIMNNTAGLQTYYLGTYCVVDMLTGMGNQTDSGGNPCSGKDIYDALFLPNGMSFQELSFLPWKRYMFGGMYDYVNGVYSVEATKYMFSTKLGYPDCKEKIGVYDVYSKFPTSLYESEIDAYLSKYGHRDEFYNSIFHTNGDPNKALRLYVEDDLKNSRIEPLTDEERAFLEDTRYSQFYCTYGCTEYQDIEGLCTLIGKEYKDADVTLTGKVITIVENNANGEKCEFKFEFSEVKSMFGTTYISGKEYAQQLEAYANHRLDKGLIDEKDIEKYKKAYEKEVKKSEGKEQVELITDEEYAQFIKFKLAGDLLEDTYVYSKVRKVEKFNKIKDTILGVIGIGSIILACIFPGTAPVAILGLVDAVLGVADGAIRMSQGDTEDGLLELGISTFGVIGGASELSGIMRNAKNAKNAAKVVALLDETDDVKDFEVWYQKLVQCSKDLNKTTEAADTAGDLAKSGKTLDNIGDVLDDAKDAGKVLDKAGDAQKELSTATKAIDDIDNPIRPSENPEKYMGKGSYGENTIGSKMDEAITNTPEHISETGAVGSGTKQLTSVQKAEKVTEEIEAEVNVLEKVSGGSNTVVKASKEVKEVTTVVDKTGDIIDAAGDTGKSVKKVTGTLDEVDELKKVGTVADGPMGGGSVPQGGNETPFGNSGEYENLIPRTGDEWQELLSKRYGAEYVEWESKNKEIEDILTSLKGDGFKNNPLRISYETEVKNLANYAAELFDKGYTEEEVARLMNQARRELGIEYKYATPQPLRNYIYYVNQIRYGDPLGPTYEYLRYDLPILKQKTDAEIIISSSKPNFNIDVLLEKFKIWMEENYDIIPR